jgi:hypothetical protein
VHHGAFSNRNRVQRRVDGDAMTASKPRKLTRTQKVRGRSCQGYTVQAHDIDLAKPIVVLKICHTTKTIHAGAEP